MSGRRARIDRQAARGLARVYEVLGGPAGVARALGLAPQSVRVWRRVPAGRVPAVLAACRGLVSLREIDPDGRPMAAQEVIGG